MFYTSVACVVDSRRLMKGRDMHRLHGDKGHLKHCSCKMTIPYCSRQPAVNDNPLDVKMSPTSARLFTGGTFSISFPLDTSVYSKNSVQVTLAPSFKRVLRLKQQFVLLFDGLPALRTTVDIMVQSFNFSPSLYS